MVVSRITRMTTAAAATSSKTKNSRGLAIFSKEGPYASHMVRLRPVLTSHPGLVPEIPQVPSTSTANTTTPVYKMTAIRISDNSIINI